MPRPKKSGSSVVKELPRQRNPRGEGVRLKGEVIQAAMRLLDSRSVSDLSLRMVAKEAGVAAPSIYAHFRDANAMICEVIRECWVQMGDEMVQAARRSRARTARGVLKAQMRAYVRYAMERSSRYQLLFAPSVNTEVLDLDGPLRPAYRPVFESIMRIEVENGILPAKDAVSAALLILSLAHGRIALAHLAPLRRGNSASNVEKFVTDTLERLFV